MKKENLKAIFKKLVSTGVIFESANSFRYAYQVIKGKEVLNVCCPMLSAGDVSVIVSCCSEFNCKVFILAVEEQNGNSITLSFE